jgi:hypothetical protein
MLIESLSTANPDLPVSTTKLSGYQYDSTTRSKKIFMCQLSRIQYIAKFEKDENKQNEQVDTVTLKLVLVNSKMEYWAE